MTSKGPPKAKNTGSLLRFLTKQQPTTSNADDRVTTPSTSSNAQDNRFGTPKEHWNDLSRRYSTQDEGLGMMKDTSRIAKSFEISKNELIERGLDEQQSSQLYVPIDEFVRSFEINLVRCCVTSNCAIAIPPNTSSSRVVAILLFNFLRWFPRSRALIVCSSVQTMEDWTTDFLSIGISEDAIRKVNTVSDFKNLRSDVGRVVVCPSPQCATKIVETAAEMVDDVRLCVVDMPNSDGSAKYKPIMASLSMRDTFFRCVLVTTSTKNASRRTAVIMKRQQTITSMLISDWVEQTEADHAFRTSSVPPGIEVRYWQDAELANEHVQLLAEWEQVCHELMRRAATKGVVPTHKMSRLVWVGWDSLRQQSAKQHGKIEKELTLAEFACQVYRILLLDGVKAAEMYISQTVDVDRCEVVQLEIISNPNMSSFFEKLTTMCRVTLSDAIIKTHVKYGLLAEYVKTYLSLGQNVCGIVLVRNEVNAWVVQDSLRGAVSCDVVRIVPDDHVSDGRGPVWPMMRISTVFMENKPKIAVMNVRSKGFLSALDHLPKSRLRFVVALDRESVRLLNSFDGQYLALLHSKSEELRRLDGQVHVDEPIATTKGPPKIGALQIYDFKFEPSDMRLNGAQLPIAFFYPKEGAVDKRIKNMSSSNLELSSKEHFELVQRCGKYDVSQYRRPKTVFLSFDTNAQNPKVFSSSDVVWNQDLQYLGDVNQCKMSKRLVEYLSSKKLERGRRTKRRFRYNEDEVDTRRIETLDMMLRKLNFCGL